MAMQRVAQDEYSNDGNAPKIADRCNRTDRKSDTPMHAGHAQQRQHNRRV